MEIQVGPYHVVLHAQPINILETFTQNNRKAPESGGVLLGKLINNQINIMKISVPTPLDKSSRTNFERSKISAQIILDYEFYNSNGQLTYLGEWHTHPEELPTPSSIDLHMLRDQFKNNNLMTDFLLLLIKGTKGFYIRVIDNKGYYESKI